MSQVQIHSFALNHCPLKKGLAVVSVKAIQLRVKMDMSGCQLETDLQTKRLCSLCRSVLSSSYSGCKLRLEALTPVAPTAAGGLMS